MDTIILIGTGTSGNLSYGCDNIISRHSPFIVQVCDNTFSETLGERLGFGRITKVINENCKRKLATRITNVGPLVAKIAIVLNVCLWIKRRSVNGHFRAVDCAIAFVRLRRHVS